MDSPLPWAQKTTKTFQMHLSFHQFDSLNSIWSELCEQDLLDIHLHILHSISATPTAISPKWSRRFLVRRMKTKKKHSLDKARASQTPSRVGSSVSPSTSSLLRISVQKEVLITLFSLKTFNLTASKAWRREQREKKTNFSTLLL